MAGSDVRIVLLGNAGVGKSAAGNTILGRPVFREVSSTDDSWCREWDQCETNVAGRKVLVADTLGIFDASLTDEFLKVQIVNCVRRTRPHVFLLVIRLGTRFTKEDLETTKWIQETFSKLALQFTIVLFTGVDAIDIPVEDCIEKSRALEQLIRECGGRYHAFDKRKKDQTQVTRLLDKIDMMVEDHGGQHYTEEMYVRGQRKIQEEEERKRREEEMKRQGTGFFTSLWK